MGAGRRFIQNGVRWVRSPSERRILPHPAGYWLDVRLDGPISEQSSPRGPGASLGLLELLRTLDAVATDPRFDGVLIRISGALGSFGHASAVGRSLARLKDSGKRVAVWARGLSIDQYAMVAAADVLWMPESAELYLMGLSIERFFLKGLLEQIGVRPEVVHVGRYKSAGETFTRDGMSDTEREQLEAWQDDVFDELVGSIARGRGLSPEEVRDRIDQGPYPARLALEAGLIDGLAYADELDDRLEAVSMELKAHEQTARRVRRVEAGLYFQAVVDNPGWVPLFRPPACLVQWVAAGNISRSAASRGISDSGVQTLLEQIRLDPSVRGVLLRIESPGGDALASDLIHRQIEQLRREKPVVVSMGDVVASGGYYMAAAADAIFAEGVSLTGSIGVVGGKMNLEGLYEKLGVSREGVTRGARAGLLSEARGYSADERAAVRREMETIYDTFLDRVASGRQLDRKEVEAVAQGRVWSGRRALDLGLVDMLGGPLEALEELLARAGLQGEAQVPIVTLPRRSFWPSWLWPMLSGARGHASGL